jgi:hypothetical protein
VSLDNFNDVPHRPYVLALGPSTDPLLAETLSLLKAQHPAIEVQCVSDPFAADLSVYADWRRGRDVMDGVSLGATRRLDEASTVLALRVFPHEPDDDRFDFGDNRYRRGETYAAWLALLSDPAVRVLNRPGGLWPPAEGLSRFQVRAIARRSGVTTIREVIASHVPPQACWRLHLHNGAIQKLDGDVPLADSVQPSSYLYVDSPWQRVIVSRVTREIMLDELADGHLSDLDRNGLMTEAHRVFSALDVDVGHAIFLRDGGRFAFSSVSLMTPPSCSRLHIQNLAIALLRELVFESTPRWHTEADR